MHRCFHALILDVLDISAAAAIMICEAYYQQSTTATIGQEVLRRRGFRDSKTCSDLGERMLRKTFQTRHNQQQNLSLEVLCAQSIHSLDGASSECSTVLSWCSKD